MDDAGGAPSLETADHSLSDRELLRETRTLVRHERHLQGAIIDHLAEIDARGLYLELIAVEDLPPAADGTPAEEDFVPGTLTDCGMGSCVPIINQRRHASAKWSAVLYDPPHALVGRLSRSGPPGSCAFRWRYP